MKHLNIEKTLFEKKLKAAKVRFINTELLLSHSLYTGANSSVLLGIITGEGLLPLGALRSQGRVPFSGELTGWGTFSEPTMSINHFAISTTTGADIDFALNYTKESFNRSSWSPTRSIEILDFLNKAKQDGIPQTGMNRSVENLRNAYWNVLSPLQKNLVKNSFPLLIEITPDSKRLENDYHLIPISNPNGLCINEIAIKGGIWSKEIKGIYVPKIELANVREILKLHGQSSITVNEIEPLWEIWIDPTKA